MEQFKHTVTDEIAQNYVNWQSGDIISISSGTGGGKSYFVQEVLSRYAKEHDGLILYLVPRTNLKEQIEGDLKKAGIKNIDIKTYQTFEAIYKQKHDHNLEWLQVYKYIVCDESHYFINDADFNDTTDISLDLILSNENAITLLLSATGEIIVEYIKKFFPKRKMIEYFIERDFSYIHSLSAYQAEKELHRAMDWLAENKHKTIIFIQSAKKAYELYKKYESYSTFVCGKENDFYEFVDEKKVEIMLENEKFDSLFLITTSVLDVGVNIIDEELHHIIIDMVDIDTLIQCLGRKRLTSDKDYINLLVRNYTNKQLGGFISKERKLVDDGKLYFKEGVSALMKKYYRKALSDIFFIDESGTLNVNKMKYLKSATNFNRFNRYVTQSNGFIKEVSKQLKYKEKVEILDYITERKNRMVILQKYVGVEFLNKDESRDMIRELNFRRGGKPIKSLSGIEKILNLEGYPFTLKFFRAYRVNEDGVKKQYRIWTLKDIGK